MFLRLAITNDFLLLKFLEIAANEFSNIIPEQ